MHTIRKFNKADAGTTKELILSILIKEYPFDKSAYSDSDLDKIHEVYGGAKETFMVIEEDGAVVGTAGVKEDSKESALLRRLFVDIKHRGKGYGKELIAGAIGFCKEKGYKRIYFRCTDRMEAAMNLCLKNGFKEVEALEVSGFRIHNLELKL